LAVSRFHLRARLGFSIPSSLPAGKPLPADAENDHVSFEMASPELRWPVPSHAGQSLSERSNAVATQPSGLCSHAREASERLKSQ
jgi:hypothetical protein